MTSSKHTGAHSSAPARTPQPRKRDQESKGAGLSSAKLNPLKPKSPKKKSNPQPLGWTWADVVIMLALLALSIMVSNSVLGSGLTQLMPSIGKIGVRTLLLVGFSGAELLALSFLAHKRAQSFSELFRLKIGRGQGGGGQSVLWVMGLLLALRVFSMGWSYLTESIGWYPPAADDIVSLFGNGAFGLALAVFATVLCAPLVEELIFRGVIQGALGKRLPLAAAMVGSSVIFATYHLTLWASVPNLALGLGLGFLASTRKTLWPAIALHALYNATLIMAAFYLAV